MTLSLFKMVRNIVRVVKLIFLQSPVVVTVCRREQVPLGFAHVIAHTTNANQCVPVVDRECVDHGVLEDLGGHSELAGVHDRVHVLLPAQVPVGALGHQLVLLQPRLQIVLPVVAWEVKLDQTMLHHHS